jgi:acetolactate decarboxylase
MKKYKFSLFLLLLLVVACSTLSNRRNAAKSSKDSKWSTFFQYNIWGAFVNRVFDGDLSVKQLQSKGDIGLGSFDLLDGEMVMLDGITYRIREDGVVSVGAKDDQIVYADATFFRKENEFTTSENLNYDLLRKVLNSHLPSVNNFYAFKISGEFDTIKLGGLHKQSQPFTRGLDYLIPNRPVFEGKKVKGTMVGFYCPPFIGDINTAGYHFHFISDDKKLGGHVMEIGATSSLNVAMQKLVNYEFRLPQSQDFEKVQLDKQFQYNKK